MILALKHRRPLVEDELKESQKAEDEGTSQRLNLSINRVERRKTC